MQYDNGHRMGCSVGVTVGGALIATNNKQLTDNVRLFLSDEVYDSTTEAATQGRLAISTCISRFIGYAARVDLLMRRKLRWQLF